MSAGPKRGYPARGWVGVSSTKCVVVVVGGGGEVRVELQVDSRTPVVMHLQVCLHLRPLHTFDTLLSALPLCSCRRACVGEAHDQEPP
jgi:hypothetical protein